jgi:hypothetical protein
MTTENLDLDNLDIDALLESDNGPKALRDALKKQKEARSALEKELADLRKEKRTSTIESVVKEKGLDPKVAEIIPADADPAEWLEQYGDVFGAKPAEQQAAQEQGSQQQVTDANTRPLTAPTAPHPLQAQFQNLSSTQAGAQAPTTPFDPSAMRAALAEGDLEGFENFIRSGTPGA